MVAWKRETHLNSVAAPVLSGICRPQEKGYGSFRSQEAAPSPRPRARSATTYHRPRAPERQPHLRGSPTPCKKESPSPSGLS